MLLIGLGAVSLGVLASAPAGARATRQPVELRAVQAAPAQGGIATYALEVPSPGRRCSLDALSPLVAVAGPISFECPTAETIRGVYLPANRGRHRERWWLELVVTDRAGRASRHAVAVEAKSSRWPGARGLPRVGIVGDSITNMANDTMVELMGPSASLRIDGRNGYLISQQLPTLRNTIDGPYGRAKAAVAELGTNNVVYALYSSYWREDPALPKLVETTGNWQAQLDAEVALLLRAPCGLLVNVTTSTGEPAFNARAAALNAAMASAVAQHPSLHLVDWAGALARHPDWYGHGNLMAEIHPLPAGQRGLVQLIDDALASGCPRPAR